MKGSDRESNGKEASKGYVCVREREGMQGVCVEKKRKREGDFE